ncbi:hypothetical protein ACFTAO_19425 [Paenibacillus rhizoplanae]
MPRAVSVSGGSAHGIAAWSDGTVTGWGDNKFGQVGDGTSINQYIPRQVEGLSGIVQVAAAGRVSFALSRDGEVWGWGLDYSSYIENDPLLRYQKNGEVRSSWRVFGKYPPSLRMVASASL